jgi:hypothetical protein
MTQTRTIKPWKAESQRVLSTEEAIELIESQPEPVPEPVEPILPPILVDPDSVYNPAVLNPIPTSITIPAGSKSGLEKLLETYFDTGGINPDIIYDPLVGPNIKNKLFKYNYIQKPDHGQKSIGGIYDNSI